METGYKKLIETYKMTSTKEMARVLSTDIINLSLHPEFSSLPLKLLYSVLDECEIISIDDIILIYENICKYRIIDFAEFLEHFKVKNEDVYVALQDPFPKQDNHNTLEAVEQHQLKIKSLETRMDRLQRQVYLLELKTKSVDNSRVTPEKSYASKIVQLEKELLKAVDYISNLIENNNAKYEKTQKEMYDEISCKFKTLNSSNDALNSEIQQIKEEISSSFVDPREIYTVKSENGSSLKDYSMTVRPVRDSEIEDIFRAKLNVKPVKPSTYSHEGMKKNKLNEGVTDNSIENALDSRISLKLTKDENEGYVSDSSIDKVLDRKQSSDTVSDESIFSSSSVSDDSIERVLDGRIARLKRNIECRECAKNGFSFDRHISTKEKNAEILDSTNTSYTSEQVENTSGPNEKDHTGPKKSSLKRLREEFEQLKTSVQAMFPLTKPNNVNFNIYEACLKGDLGSVQYLLLLEPSLVSKQDPYNYKKTPLHYATSDECKDVCEFLIKKGADVNAQSINGVTPLHIAAFRNQLVIAKILLDNGADYNIKDNQDRTPVDDALRGGHEGFLHLVEETKKKRSSNH